VSNEPIYRQVIRDVEARAEVGKATYGRYLMEDANGRNPLQDAYEEQIDGAKYLKQAIHERRALIEYVARLRSALEKALDHLPYGHDDNCMWDDARDAHCTCGQRSAMDEAMATLATAPLSGQPQLAPATGWRPIAEADLDKQLPVVGHYEEGVWFQDYNLWKEVAVRRGYTHYHPLSAPPLEGE
jgi:hypothetical protein